MSIQCLVITVNTRELFGMSFNMHGVRNGSLILESVRFGQNHISLVGANDSISVKLVTSKSRLNLRSRSISMSSAH